MPARDLAVLNPNLGVYLDRPGITVNKRAMTACRNVRVKNGRVVNENMGWEPFTAAVIGSVASGAPGKRILMIDQFFTVAGGQHLLFGTQTDLLRYDEGTDSFLYLTPRYETGTISINDTDSVVTGVGTAWNTAPNAPNDPDKNVKAGDEIAFTQAGERDPSVTWYKIASVDSDTQITLDAPYSGPNLAGVAYTIRRTFTGDRDDYWRTEVFPDAQPEDKDVWFATNGQDFVVSWDGTADQVTREWGLLFKCRILARFKNMMLYGDVTKTLVGDREPQKIVNSSIAIPREVDGSGDSGEFIASEGDDVLLSFVLLGDTEVAYGERSISPIQFVGGTFGFVARSAVVGIGPVSGRAVMDFGDFHEFLGADTAFRFDGISLEEFGGHVFREVLRKIDPNRKDQAFAAIDEENGEVQWVVPQTTDSDPENKGPETAYTEHYLEPIRETEEVPMTIRDLPATAYGFFQRADTIRFNELVDKFSTYNFKWNDRFFQAAFPFNLFGTWDGKVFILGTKDNQNGAAINSFARFARRALVDGRRKGFVRRIEPFSMKRPTANTYKLGVLIWVTDRPDGDLSLGKQLLHDLSHERNPSVYPRVAARFAELEFATNGIDQPWEVAGYDLDVDEAGTRPDGRVLSPAVP